MLNHTEVCWIAPSARSIIWFVTNLCYVFATLLVVHRTAWFTFMCHLIFNIFMRVKHKEITNFVIFKLKNTTLNYALDTAPSRQTVRTKRHDKTVLFSSQLAKIKTMLKLLWCRLILYYNLVLRSFSLKVGAGLGWLYYFPTWRQRRTTPN